VCRGCLIERPGAAGRMREVTAAQVHDGDDSGSEKRGMGDAAVRLNARRTTPPPLDRGQEMQRRVEGRDAARLTAASRGREAVRHAAR